MSCYALSFSINTCHNISYFSLLKINYHLPTLIWSYEVSKGVSKRVLRKGSQKGVSEKGFFSNRPLNVSCTLQFLAKRHVESINIHVRNLRENIIIFVFRNWLSMIHCIPFANDCTVYMTHLKQQLHDIMAISSFPTFPICGKKYFSMT